MAEQPDSTPGEGRAEVAERSRLGRLSRALLAHLDAWVPERIRARGPDALRRARLAVVFCYLAAGSILAFGALSASTGDTVRSLADVTGAAALALLPVVLRRIGSLQLVAHAVAGSIYAVVVFSGLRDGGFGPGFVCGAALVPMVASLLGGGRAATLWGAAVMASLVGLYSLHVIDYRFPADPNWESIAPAHRLLISLLLVGILGSIGVGYEWLKSSAVQELRDTAERLREMSLRARQAERRLRAVLDCAGEGIVGLDREGRATFVNRAALELLGLPAEALVGERLHERIRARPGREGRTERRECPVLRAIAEQRPVRVRDDVVYGAGGEPIPVEYVCTPTDLPTASGTAAVVVFRDLREQKALEAQLLQAQKLESIGQLAAGIAHEINTPAQYVGDNIDFAQGAVEDLRRVIEAYQAVVDLADEAAARGALPPEPGQEARKAAQDADLGYVTEELPTALTQAREGVERITKIVRAMKEFSHPGSPERKPLDLNRALESTATVARNEWKYAAELELDPELPPVPGLGGELNQVFLNMLVNAAHAIEDKYGRDGQKGHIRVRTRPEGDFAVVEIADDGPGIPEEIRGRIFDPFFTTKEVGRGSGQGLAIARSVVVDKHGGRIEVESTPGEGATFRIHLPLGSGPQPEDVG